MQSHELLRRATTTTTTTRVQDGRAGDADGGATGRMSGVSVRARLCRCGAKRPLTSVRSCTRCTVTNSMVHPHCSGSGDIQSVDCASDSSGRRLSARITVPRFLPPLHANECTSSHGDARQTHTRQVADPHMRLHDATCVQSFEPSATSAHRPALTAAHIIRSE